MDIIIYRLMNHDNISNNELPKFEKFTLDELNKRFDTSYISVDEAINNDPEYLFSEIEVKNYQNE